MSELSVYELETQHGELLPQRETLAFANFIVAFQQNNQANVAFLALATAQQNNGANVIIAV